MNVIWKDKLDGVYDVYVERLEPYKGELVIKHGDKTLIRKSVTISYDAQFGPDGADIYEWQDMCVEFVDNGLNK